MNSGSFQFSKPQNPTQAPDSDKKADPQKKDKGPMFLDFSKGVKKTTGGADTDSKVGVNLFLDYFGTLTQTNNMF